MKSALQTCIGTARLHRLVQTLRALADSAVAIHEADGECVFCSTESPYCALLDQASRRLHGGTHDAPPNPRDHGDRRASGWLEASSVAVNSARPVDLRACRDGIGGFAVPIIANGAVLGAISFAQGVPPTDQRSLDAVARRYRLEPGALSAAAKATKTRPDDVVRLAKQLAQILADHIADLFLDRLEERELERAYRQLSEAEARNRQILLAAKVGVWTLDADAMTRYVNPRMTGMLGYAEDEMLGRRLFDFMDRNDQAEAEAYCGRCRDDVCRSREFRFRHRDGPVIWARVCASPIRDDSGRYDGFVVLVTDMTERKATEAALRQREQELAGIVRAAPVGIGLAVDGAIDTVNDTFCRMLGYSRQELLGRSDRMIYPNQEEFERTGRVSREQIGNSGSAQVETRFRRNNGEIIDVLLSSTPLDPLDPTAGLVFSALDVTARNRNETARRETEELFSTAFHAAGTIMTVTDLETGVFENVNDAFVEITGFSRGEAIGARSVDLGLVSMADRRRFVRRLLAVGDVRNEDVRTRKKDGQPIDCLYSGHVFEVNGRKKLFSIAQDITELTQSRLHLQKSEERFALAMQASNDGVFDWDLTTDAVYYSPRYKAMLGYAEDELENHFSTWERLIEAEDRKRSWAMMRDYMNGKRDNFSLEFRMRHKDGHWVDILSRAYLVRDRDSRPIRVVGTHVDVSERKRSEREREQLQLQLLQSQKMEALGLLTGGIAHDFNNILSAILGFARLAEDQYRHLPDDKLRQYLQHIVENGERARQLVAQMLQFSRPKPSTEVTSIAVGPILQELSGILRSVIPSSIQIELTHDAETPRINIDPVQLHQIVMNICINARDAMDGKGRLRLHIGKRVLDNAECVLCQSRLNGNWVALSIADSGPGIDAAIRNQIFDPFFSTKALGKGTGLGLSVVSGIVRGLGGHLMLESAPDQGTTFTVLFPPDQSIVDRETATDRSPVVINGAGQRLLVVDDEPSITAFLSEFLGSRRFNVVSETDSKRALERINGDPGAFDLLITDQTMPGITGLELVKAARQIRPDLPVILCTGYSDQLSDETMHPWDRFLYLEKPVEHDTLLLSVAQLLGHSLEICPDVSSAASARACRNPADIDPGAVQGIPDNLAGELERAAIELDKARVDEIVGMIQSGSPELAEGFSDLAEEFRFDEILRILENGRCEPGNA